MKKEITIEQLAVMTQRGFVDLERRLGERITHIATQTGVILEALDALGTKLSVTHSLWHQDFEILQKWVKELDHRVEVIEHKGKR